MERKERRHHTREFKLEAVRLADIRGAAGSDSVSDARAQELLDHEVVATTRKSYRRNLTKKVRPLK